MKVEIYSRKAIEKLKSTGFPTNTAVISFYTPKSKRDYEENRVDYDGICDKVFYVGIPDIDIEILDDYGYTYETYLTEAPALAEFIRKAVTGGFDIICQCDYGQSRSAACAAAILQCYEARGIDIFVDYRYYPNQLVYHKVFDSLKELNSTESP
jgi:protein-tyrosine phosphatase